MPDRVTIVGGGLAGLAAASALADQDVSVTLLESRPRLGGRASSFVDRESASVIDNCQHVSMGCCTNFGHFCETVGIDKYFRREKELFFLGPEVRGITADFRGDRLVSSWLPAPFHLTRSFQHFSYLRPRDRQTIAKGLRALALTNPETARAQHFDEWLREHDQTTTAIEYFWKVVLVSALSETLERISVPHARKVFVDAFMANRRGWKVQIPTVPLDKLYGTQLTQWLSDRGVIIRLNCGVRRLAVENNSCIGLELRSGEYLQADHFVVCVPHHVVLGLLPESMQSHPDLKGISEIETAPIASVHLWFDRPITSLPHAVFVGRLSQWMFNRSRLHSRDNRFFGASPGSGSREKNSSIQPFAPIAVRKGRSDDSAGDSTENTSKEPRTNYLQVVVSAARDLPGRSRQEFIDAVLRELVDIWPQAAQAHLLHSRLVTEHKAVFSVNPASDALRPQQQSPVDNVQLAGDWTQTGWPSTMEGAVRSGYLAAENVLHHLGRNVRLVQPDLQPGLLSRILLGL